MKNSFGRNLEYIDCILCEKSSCSLYLQSPKMKDRKDGLFSTTSQGVFGETLVRCNECGLIYVNPREKKSKILADYSKIEERDYVKEKEARTDTFRQSLKTLKKYKNSGKILDVGCAAGFFMQAAQKEGFEAYGVEPNRWLSQWASKNLSLKISNTSFERVKFRNEFFDVVSFWDVLEHMTNPIEALEKANKILKKGGVLILNYPDISSFPARIFGRNWWFIVSNHLFYFTPKTIRKILEEKGFRILENHRHFQRLSFAYLLTRLGRYNKKAASILSMLCEKTGFGKIVIPYYAGQQTVVAVKERNLKS